MKVYLDPISTTSRPILLFLAESGTPAEIVKVDLFQGEHKKPEYAQINPNQCVPTLDDDGFLLTESSAILKYLAEKTRSPLYPQDLKARARVNEVMDWFNTHFYRDLGYGVVYPQTVPGAGFTNATTQSDVVSRAKEQTEARFKILRLDHRLGRSRHQPLSERRTLDEGHEGAPVLGEGQRPVERPRDLYPLPTRQAELRNRSSGIRRLHPAVCRPGVRGRARNERGRAVAHLSCHMRREL
jgi:glutathione S-transferase